MVQSSGKSAGPTSWPVGETSLRNGSDRLNSRPNLPDDPLAAVDPKSLSLGLDVVKKRDELNVSAKLIRGMAVQRIRNHAGVLASGPGLAGRGGCACAR